MRITLLALYDLHNYGIRGLHNKLIREGHEVKSVYFKYSTYTCPAYNNQEIEDLIDCIRQTKPDVLGIAVKSPLLQLFKIIVEKICKEIGCKIWVGGPHVISVPDSMAKYADEVCTGDVETEENLDDWEFPYYGKDALYVHSKEEIIGNAHIFGSRGCYFNCTFCYENIARKQYPDYRVRRKSVDRIIEETSRLKGLFPSLHEIVFSDCVFTHDNNWLEEFCRKWTETKLRFRCFGHVDLVTEQMIKNLKFAGLKWLSFGIESGSDEIRQIFGRKCENERILEVSRWCNNARVVPRWDFIVQNPFETKESDKMTRRLIKKLHRRCVIREFQLRFYPNTDITKLALKRDKITPDQIEGSVDRFGEWSHFYQLW